RKRERRAPMWVGRNRDQWKPLLARAAPAECPHAQAFVLPPLRTSGRAFSVPANRSGGASRVPHKGSPSAFAPPARTSAGPSRRLRRRHSARCTPARLLPRSGMVPARLSACRDTGTTSCPPWLAPSPPPPPSAGTPPPLHRHPPHWPMRTRRTRSEEHTSELQSLT